MMDFQLDKLLKYPSIGCANCELWESPIDTEVTSMRKIVLQKNTQETDMLKTRHKIEFQFVCEI